MADQRDDVTKKTAPSSGIEELLGEIRKIGSSGGHDVPEFKREGPLPDPVAMRREETHMATEILKGRRVHLRELNIEKIMQSGGITSAFTFSNIIVDQANRTAVDTARMFCLSHARPSVTKPPELLLLSGASGSGKSVLANCVAYEWLHCRNKDTMIIGFSRFERLRYYDQGEGEELKKKRADTMARCLGCDLLVIDGLCESGQGLTVYQQKVLSEIIRSRQERSLCTMITITLPSIRTLHQAVGDYTFESFKVYRVVTAELLGASRRQPMISNGVMLV